MQLNNKRKLYSSVFMMILFVFPTLSAQQTRFELFRTKAANIKNQASERVRRAVQQVRAHKIASAGATVAAGMVVAGVFMARHLMQEAPHRPKIVHVTHDANDRPNANDQRPNSWPLSGNDPHLSGQRPSSDPIRGTTEIITPRAKGVASSRGGGEQTVLDESLRDAVKEGKAEDVEALLEQGANPNYQNSLNVQDHVLLEALNNFYVVDLRVSSGDTVDNKTRANWNTRWRIVELLVQDSKTNLKANGQLGKKSVEGFACTNRELFRLIRDARRKRSLNQS